MLLLLKYNSSSGCESKVQPPFNQNPIWRGSSFMNHRKGRTYVDDSGCLARKLAKLVHHYREALAHDGNGHGIKGGTSLGSGLLRMNASSWSPLPVWP